MRENDFYPLYLLCADRYADLEAAAKLIMDGKLGLAQSKYNG